MTTACESATQAWTYQKLSSELCAPPRTASLNADALVCVLCSCHHDTMLECAKKIAVSTSMSHSA